MKKLGIVIITANAVGEVFTLAKDEQGNPKLDKNGKPYGFIRLEQATLDLGYSYNGGIKRTSTLKNMLAEQFEKVKDYYAAGTELPGRIARKETMDAAIGTQKGWTPKRAGSEENAPVLKKNGLTIYQQTVYDQSGTEADVIIEHDNVEEVKNWNALTPEQKGKKIALNA